MLHNNINSFIKDLSSKKAVSILSNYGKLYLVGGAIRSLIRNEKPNDIDMFLDADPEEIIDIICNLRNSGYTVRSAIKYDYEGWIMKDIIMIHPHNETESYDIVIGKGMDKHGYDFDVNSMFVELNGSNSSILHISDSKESVSNVSPIPDDKLLKLVEQIQNKQMNFATTIAFLKANAGTIHGSGQLMKRLMKRINYGWTLANTPENIEIAVYLLDSVHPNIYKQHEYRGECCLAVANLMKYLMNVGYDLKTFVHDKKLEYFASVLNVVAYSGKETFDYDECRKIMEYCGTEYDDLRKLKRVE